MTLAYEREYVVLDSRAQYDVDAAQILEACGPDKPKRKRLHKDWGGMGAVLVYFTDWDGGKYTKTVTVGVIL